MATINRLLGIICLIAFSLDAKPNSRAVVQRDSFAPFAIRNNATFALRARILTIAKSQLGVKEATGNNDGDRVEAYLKVTNLPKGNPWCAAFVSWVFKQIGYSQPRTAWSPSLFPLKRLVEHPEPADVLGIYSLRLKRIAHCGLVEQIRHNWIISIEGNTNNEGAREGDGVYRKWRHKRTIHKFANWIK